jgi:hypothetical protein
MIADTLPSISSRSPLPSTPFSLDVGVFRARALACHRSQGGGAAEDASLLQSLHPRTAMAHCLAQVVSPVRRSRAERFRWVPTCEVGGVRRQGHRCPCDDLGPCPANVWDGRRNGVPDRITSERPQERWLPSRRRTNVLASGGTRHEVSSSVDHEPVSGVVAAGPLDESRAPSTRSPCTGTAR